MSGAAAQQAANCPLNKPHGEIVCRDGILWALTYSEMGPPGQRAAVRDCPHCRIERIAP